MNLPFISRKKYDKIKQELSELKRDEKLSGWAKVQKELSETTRISALEGRIEKLKRLNREQEEKLNIYKALLKNVVDIDMIKKILDNEKEMVIQKANEMSEEGMFGGSF